MTNDNQIYKDYVEQAMLVPVTTCGKKREIEGYVSWPVQEAKVMRTGKDIVFYDQKVINKNLVRGKL